jgi:hypothetical protein
MSLQSPCSITFFPATGAHSHLVAAGGWLLAAPVFSAEQDLFEADGVLLGNAFFKPLGGALVTMEFTAEIPCADLLAAQQAHLLEASAALCGMSGSLVITNSLGAELATVARAVILGITPDLPATEDATLSLAYVILASIPALPET